jgi:hypothetical protein
MATHARLRRGGTDGPQLALAGASVLIAATVLPASSHLRFDLILPVASLVLLAAGFALAAVVRTRPVRRGRLSYRDVAALLVFFGFGAALLGDPAAVASLFEGETR